MRGKPCSRSMFAGLFEHMLPALSAFARALQLSQKFWNSLACLPSRPAMFSWHVCRPVCTFCGLHCLHLQEHLSQKCWNSLPCLPSRPAMFSWHVCRPVCTFFLPALFAFARALESEVLEQPAMFSWHLLHFSHLAVRYSIHNGSIRVSWLTSQVIFDQDKLLLLYGRIS